VKYRKWIDLKHNSLKPTLLIINAYNIYYV